MRLTLAAVLITATALPAQQTGGNAILMPMRDKTLKRVDYKLTDAITGVRFDLDGDGLEEQIAWTHTNSGLAFLALDRNGNGKIDNGTELFGNHTYSGVGNGFAALNVASNRAGMIMEGVPLYEQLLLWEDADHNGLSEPYEIVKFSDHYVGIDGGYLPDTLMDKCGNEFRFRGGAAIREPGKSKKYPMSYPGADAGLLIPIYDVFFVTR